MGIGGRASDGTLIVGDIRLATVAAEHAEALRRIQSTPLQHTGILRLAERDTYDHRRWHDTLLMERVVDPTERPQPPMPAPAIDR